MLCFKLKNYLGLKEIVIKNKCTEKIPLVPLLDHTPKLMNGFENRDDCKKLSHN